MQFWYGHGIVARSCLWVSEFNCQWTMLENLFTNCFILIKNFVMTSRLPLSLVIQGAIAQNFVLQTRCRLYWWDVLETPYYILMIFSQTQKITKGGGGNGKLGYPCPILGENRVDESDFFLSSPTNGKNVFLGWTKFISVEQSLTIINKELLLHYTSLAYLAHQSKLLPIKKKLRKLWKMFSYFYFW